MEQKTALSINDMRPGESAVVISTAELDQHTAKKFLDLGLIRGERVTFVQRAPLGDPVWIELKGYQLAFRKDIAGLIRVERIMHEG